MDLPPLLQKHTQERRWWRADDAARRVATPFSRSSRRELTMSHGRAREAADDGKVRVGRPPRCGELAGAEPDGNRQCRPSTGPSRPRSRPIATAS
jgi:hypothetical protein